MLEWTRKLAMGFVAHSGPRPVHSLASTQNATIVKDDYPPSLDVVDGLSRAQIWRSNTVKEIHMADLLADRV